MRKSAKKFIILFLLAFAVSFQFWGAQVHAEEEKTYFGSESYEWAVGAVSPIGIYAASNEAVSEVNLTVTYDPDMLEYYSGGELVEEGKIKINTGNLWTAEYKQMLNFVPRTAGDCKITIEASEIKTTTGKTVKTEKVSVNVHIPLSESCKLSGITVNGEAVSGFEADKTEYNLEVSPDTENLEIVTAPESVKTEISKNVLKTGKNKITVFTDDGAGGRARYILYVTRPEPETVVQTETQSETVPETTVPEEQVQDSSFLSVMMICLAVFLVVAIAALVILKIVIVQRNRKRRQRRKRMAAAAAAPLPQPNVRRKKREISQQHSSAAAAAAENKVKKVNVEAEKAKAVLQMPKTDKAPESAKKADVKTAEKTKNVSKTEEKSRQISKSDIKQSEQNKAAPRDKTPVKEEKPAVKEEKTVPSQEVKAEAKAVQEPKKAEATKETLPQESKETNNKTENSEIEIAVEHVTMEFKREKDESTSIKELLIRTVRGQRSYEKFRALDDVSFTINKGEVVGIIGTNGSGKSTILKIISGVLKPTKGSVKVDKNKIQLLTLGTGFDYELTGRENVYLNGAIIGYTKEFIDEHYDEIVKFAELEGFMEEKVRNYSSGMISRLGFAIATIRNTPEILILDEVLSVGDMFFRKKSEARIKEMMHGGSTVLIVSHSTSVIRNNCTKAVWIEKGILKAVGDPKEVCAAYEKMNA